MNKKTILGYIFTPILMLLSASCLFAGLSIVCQNYERTTYLNAHLFIDNEHPNLLFKYDSPHQIRNEKTRLEFLDAINSFNGETKYYSYSCLFGVTDYASISDSVQNYQFADINYLLNKSTYSTNLIKLSSPTNYAVAFNEEEKTYIDASQINIRTGEKISVSAYFASELIDSDLIWSIEDQSIASIDSKGVIRGIADGNTVVRAEYRESVAEAEVVVSSSTGFKTEIKKIIPVVVPESFAISRYSSIEDALGKQFISTLGGVEYTMSVGGTYPSSVSDPLYKNKFYIDNIGELIYFLRSPKYYLPVSAYYVLVGNAQKVNLNIHGDMKFFKTFTKLSFSIPSEMPANNYQNPNFNNKTIASKISEINSSKFFLTGVLLIVISLFVFLANDVLFGGNKKVGGFFPEISLIACFVAPPLEAAFIKTIQYKGIELFVSNSIAGWIFMGCTIILAAYLTFKIIRKRYINIRKRQR